MANEIKVIPDRICAKLRKEATKDYSLSEYIDKFTSNLSDTKINFLRYKINYEQSLKLLKYIFEFEHLNFGEILKENNITPSVLYNRYLIPISSSTDWFNGRYPFPEYIKLLLCDSLNIPNMPSGFYTESQNQKRARYKSEERFKKSTNSKTAYSSSVVLEDESDLLLNQIDMKLNNLRVHSVSSSPSDILNATNYLDSIIKR